MPLRGTASGALSLHGGAMAEPQTLAGALVCSELRSASSTSSSRTRGRSTCASAAAASGSSSARAGAGRRRGCAISGGGSLQRRPRPAASTATSTSACSRSLSQTVTEAAGKRRARLQGQRPARAALGLRPRARARRGAQVASFPEAVRDVNGKITFSARRVAARRLLGQGRRRARELERRRRARGARRRQLRRCRSRPSALALKPRDGVDLKLGGRGELSWKRATACRCSAGRLRVDEFVYTRTDQDGPHARRDVRPRARRGRGLRPRGRPARARPARSSTASRCYIRNNLIDAELRLENDKLPFRLVGTDQRFGVIGHMSVRKGTVRFRDHDVRHPPGRHPLRRRDADRPELRPARDDRGAAHRTASTTGTSRSTPSATATSSSSSCRATRTWPRTTSRCC